MDIVTILLIIVSCVVEICATNFCYEIHLEKKDFFERKNRFYTSIVLFGFLLSLCEFVDIQKSELIASPILFLLIEQIIYKGSYQRKAVGFLVSLLSIKGMEFLFIILMQALPILEENSDTIFWLLILSVKMFSLVVLIVIKERINRFHNKFEGEKWIYMIISMSCITAMFIMVYIWLKEPGESTVNGKVIIAFLIMFIGNIAIFEMRLPQSHWL